MACERCAELERRLAQLERRIKELEKKLAEKATPTPDFVKENIKHEHHKPGQKEGHTGMTREPPADFAEVKVLRQEFHEGCGGKLVTVGSRARVTSKLIPALFKVTKTIIEEQQCKKCGMVVEGPFTEAFDRCFFDLDTHLEVADLKLDKNLPYNKIQAMFSGHGMTVSQGNLAMMLQRLAGNLEEEYLKLFECVSEADNVNMDDTGWRINGVNHSLWSASDDSTSLFVIDRHKSSEVARRILGNFDGVLTTDEATSFNWYPHERQTCWAHIMRISRDNLKRFPKKKEAREMHQTLKRIFNKATTFTSLGPPMENRLEMKQVFHKMVNRLHRKNYRIGRCGDLALRLIHSRDRLFTFVINPDVEPTNNAAERELRPLVVQRKISYGNRSQRGADATVILKSLMETCKKRGLDFKTWAKEVLSKKLASRQTGS